jgi:SNF2 family DNA or RNA helicase
LLNSKYRIAMTGTPVQNALTDFFSRVKFLYLDPLNDLKVWKYLFRSEKQQSVVSKPHVVDKKADVRDARYSSWLLILSDTLILRRTKADKISINDELRNLVDLPTKAIDVIHIELNKTEKFIYDKIFSESAEKDKKFLINRQRKLIGGCLIGKLIGVSAGG